MDADSRGGGGQPDLRCPPPRLPEAVASGQRPSGSRRARRSRARRGGKGRRAQSDWSRRRARRPAPPTAGRRDARLLRSSRSHLWECVATRATPPLKRRRANVERQARNRAPPLEARHDGGHPIRKTSIDAIDRASGNSARSSASSARSARTNLHRADAARRPCNEQSSERRRNDHVADGCALSAARVRRGGRGPRTEGDCS